MENLNGENSRIMEARNLATGAGLTVWTHDGIRQMGKKHL